jgi:hypothetical protein
MLPSGAVRRWKTRLIALGLASCLTGCQILPPSESISTPSLQLREALGHELAPIAIYGGVVSSGRVGALILTQDNLQFYAWIEMGGPYESKGLKIPYKNINFVYSDKGGYFTQELIVIERCDGCKDGDRYHNFDFRWDEAGRNSAQRTLLSLLDRTDTTHLPSAEMWNARDRVVAVVTGGITTEADYVPVVEWGSSGRAKQGANAGLPFMSLVPIGGPYMLGLAIGAAGIGATVGAVLGVAEELSDSEQARMARREMMAQSKAAPIQTWLLDSVMALVLKQGATANAGEKGHLFIRVDDPIARTGYRPLFREAIDHVLEVRVRELRIVATDSKDQKEVQDIFFELEGFYSVSSMAQGGRYPVLLAHAYPVCRSTSYPVTAWQVEDAKLFREELHRCVGQLSEKIVSDFLTRFPDATTLRNQRGSDRIGNDSHSTTIDPAK